MHQQTSYSCEACDKKITTNASLKKIPKKTVHENILKICSICQKSNGETNIKRHEKGCRKKYTHAVQKHTVNEEDSSEIPCQYSCVKCKKYYDNKESLQSHIRLEHEQKQIIKCEKCKQVGH